MSYEETSHQKRKTFSAVILVIVLCNLFLLLSDLKLGARGYMFVQAQFGPLYDFFWYHQALPYDCLIIGLMLVTLFNLVFRPQKSSNSVLAPIAVILWYATVFFSPVQLSSKAEKTSPRIKNTFNRVSTIRGELQDDTEKYGPISYPTACRPIAAWVDWRPAFGKFGDFCQNSVPQTLKKQRRAVSLRGISIAVWSLGPVAD